MKKLNYLLAAVAVVAMAGCSKEKDVTPASNAVKLHVTVEDSDTRVSIDNAYAYAFQSGDVISVLTDGGEPVEFEASEGGTSVDFNGTFEQGQAIGSYAMYPASEYHMADGDEVLFSIPEDLTWKANETFMPMLGKINNGTATFKAVGGVMKLIVYNIPASAKYLQFTAPLQQISGWFTIDDASVQAPVIVTDETDASDDTIVIDFSANYSANKVFYIPLPTGTISGFTVSFLDENRDGINGATKTANATLTVTRNKIIIAPALNMGQEIVLWQEDFSSFTTGTQTGKGYGNVDLTYATNDSGTKTYNEALAGGTSPELLIKGNKTFTVSGIPTAGSETMTLKYKTNAKSLQLSSTTSGVTISPNVTNTKAEHTATVSNPNKSSTITLVFKANSSDNVRLDDVILSIAHAPYTGPSITVNPSEVTMEITNGDYDTAEATVTYENSVDDLGISVIVDQQTYPWLEFVDLVNGDLYISALKNLTGASRTGSFTLRATGVTKTVTVTQASTLVPNPEVTVTAGNGTFTASWTAAEHASSYVAYLCTAETNNPTTGTNISGDLTLSNGVYSVTESVTNNQPYFLYVKVNEVTGNYVAPDGYVMKSFTPAPVSTTATLTLSSSKKFGTQSGSTLNDNKNNTWTVTGAHIQNSYQSTYSGQQFGTSSTDDVYKFTANFSGKTVTSVKIQAAAGGTTATYSIKVNNSVWQSGNLSRTATIYTGTGGASGTVEIILDQNNGGKAVYLGSIEVVYSE